MPNFSFAALCNELVKLLLVMNQTFPFAPLYFAMGSLGGMRSRFALCIMFHNARPDTTAMGDLSSFLIGLEAQKNNVKLLKQLKKYDK